MNNIENSFEKLFAINVNEKTEKKENLTYLSWAWAWAEFKKVFPSATFLVKKNEQGLPYFHDPSTGYMCFTEVSADGLTYEMWLPVMDGKNKAMKDVQYDYTVYDKYKKSNVNKTVEAATMFDINKTVMRCLTKNLAMFGLGLYIYAGEDLPEGETEPPASPIAKPTTEQLKQFQDLNGDIKGVAVYFKTTVEELTAEQVAWAIERKTPKKQETKQAQPAEPAKNQAEDKVNE